MTLLSHTLMGTSVDEIDFCPIDMRMVPGSKRAILLSPWENPFTGTIPEGFMWDGASIPWFAWSLTGLTPFHPKIREAALAHDYLYSLGMKKYADEVFKRLMVELGANAVQVFVCYQAVKKFGKAKI